MVLSTDEKKLLNMIQRNKPMNLTGRKSYQQKPAKWDRAIFLYLFWAALRLILTCLPQSGYIHPDEYFQSIEVIAGKIFDVDFKQPWEFNKTQPIRSIITPYVTVGFPYRLLQVIDLGMLEYFQFSINIPYFLLIFPRLFIGLSSFLVDFCLYKICKINNEPYTQKLLLLASSYVMLVYGTRTFSNTIEMILMSVLLYLVADSQAYSHTVISQNEYLSEKYNQSKAAVDRAYFHKLRLSLPSHSMRHCIAISVVTVTGVFNRPTFIAFAFAPLFFWFHRGLGNKTVHFAHFHFRMFLFLMCSLVVFFMYVLIDSFYFGFISMAEIMEVGLSINNFVVTPVNFIRYNIDVKNLAEHGLHSRSQHVLVNLPLLYNVLGVITIYRGGTMLYRFIKGNYTSLPHIYSTQGLMMTSIIVPTVFLSYFQHQEPRFLIPITLPIVLLFGSCVIHTPSFYRLWLFFNVVCVIFYGFIHQAGLYPATVHLSQELRLSQRSTTPIHLVTSHVYSLPLALLQQQNTQRLYGSGASKHKKSKRLFLQEMGSRPLQTVVKHLAVVNEMCYQNGISDPQIYLLLPTSKFYELNQIIKQSNLTLTDIKVFYPHISTEALPEFHNVLEFYMDSVVNFIGDLARSCGLGLYKVHKNIITHAFTM